MLGNSKRYRFCEWKNERVKMKNEDRLLKNRTFLPLFLSLLSSSPALSAMTNDALTSIDWEDTNQQGSEARRFSGASHPREASHASLVSMQVVETLDLFQAPLQKVSWQLELCWQVPLKGKECVTQERWSMFHCHLPHRINGWPRIFPSATFPSGWGVGGKKESGVWCYKSP